MEALWGTQENLSVPGAQLKLKPPSSKAHDPSGDARHDFDQMGKRITQDYKRSKTYVHSNQYLKKKKGIRKAIICKLI